MSSQTAAADERRIVITGMGIITTIGQSVPEFLASLRAGRSGITRWKNMDARIYSKIGGDMSDFDLNAHFAAVGKNYPAPLIQFAQKLLRATPIGGRMASAAALQADVDAGRATAAYEPERVGHVLAGHNLNANYTQTNTVTLMEEPEFIDPLYGLMFLDTDVLSVTSELLTIKGPSFTVGGACASGNMALLTALDLIRSGRADAMLVTSVSSDLSPIILQGWSLIDALAIRSFNDDPARASRPFDAKREGFVPSESSAALFLETLPNAIKRGARIYAELLGASAASDASRLTKPDLGGQMRAMRAALNDAHIAPEQINYINAHATSTPLGDAVEIAAIKNVFGDHAYRIPVNSTKSLLGHCICSAGIVELIATVLQMQNDFVHPTINQEEKDPELDLDFVPNQMRAYHMNYALSNSFGFGGLNSSVVVGRVK